jgi:hypothetical protein
LLIEAMTRRPSLLNFLEAIAGKFFWSPVRDLILDLQLPSRRWQKQPGPG